MQRTRTKGDMSSEVFTSTNAWHKYSDNTYGGDTKVGTTAVGSSEVMTDRVVPKFHSRSAHGEIFNNPMTQVKESRILTPGMMSFKHQWGSGSNYTLHNWQPNYRPMFDTWVDGEFWSHLGHDINVANLRDRAGTQAMANVAAPDLYGAVALGELRETLAFLRNPAEAWLKFAKRARVHKNARHKLSDFKTTGDFVGDNWLAYRYAVRPMVADIQGTFKAASRVLGAQRNTARGFASDSNTNELTWTHTEGVITYEYTKSTSTEISVRAGSLWEQRAGFDPYGLGIGELPLAGWELIPFSFVLDWFVNVGTFIEALTPRVGVKHLAQWTTLKQTQKTTLSGVTTSLSGPRTLTGASPTIGIYETESVTRSPGITLGLSYNPNPFPRDFFGMSRTVDALALANSIFRSR
jgi:hypothetical protein